MENKGEAENCPVDVVVEGGKSSINDASTVPVPKEKCIAEAAAKVVSAPAVPVLKERNIRDEWKRGTPPNPVKVPPTKLFSYADRYLVPSLHFVILAHQKCFLVRIRLCFLLDHKLSSATFAVSTD
jgi:hypothetical protein